MLYHFFTKNIDNIKIIYKIIYTVLICLFIFGILCCTSAFFVTKIDMSYEVIPFNISIILGFSAAFSGFVLSRSAKENGLFWGIFAGVIIFLFVSIIAIVSGYFKINTNFFTKFLITVISGAIGGIVGVNIN